MERRETLVTLLCRLRGPTCRVLARCAAGRVGVWLCSWWCQYLGFAPTRSAGHAQGAWCPAPAAALVPPLTGQRQCFWGSSCLSVRHPIRILFAWCWSRFLSFPVSWLRAWLGGGEGGAWEGALWLRVSSPESISSCKVQSHLSSAS